MQASDMHSLSGEPKWRDKLGHGKNVSQQGALTFWRAQTERQVRSWKGCEPARVTYQLESSDGRISQDTERMCASKGTHQLESLDGEASQDTEIIQVSKGHSHPREPRQRDKSGHRKGASQQGKLTDWRAQTERQVRTQKECKPARGTYRLESPDRETSQDMERVQASEGGELTFWRAQTERQVRTWKECEPARVTHQLESSDGRISQDTEHKGVLQLTQSDGKANMHVFITTSVLTMPCSNLTWVL